MTDRGGLNEEQTCALSRVAANLLDAGYRIDELFDELFAISVDGKPASNGAVEILEARS
jgi:hypothetical protein